MLGLRFVAAALIAASAAAGLPALAGQEQPPAAAVTAEPDIEAGAESYGAECRACHTVSIAPTLRGVAGRPIASVAAFSGYSDALKARKGETWTDANLDAFIKAPGVFAPGSRMVKATPDDQTRANIIAYMKTLPPPREEQR